VPHDRTLTDLVGQRGPTRRVRRYEPRSYNSPRCRTWSAVSLGCLPLRCSLFERWPSSVDTPAYPTMSSFILPDGPRPTGAPGTVHRESLRAQRAGSSVDPWDCGMKARAVSLSCPTVGGSAAGDSVTAFRPMRCGRSLASIWPLGLRCRRLGNRCGFAGLTSCRRFGRRRRWRRCVTSMARPRLDGWRLCAGVGLVARGRRSRFLLDSLVYLRLKRSLGLERTTEPERSRRRGSVGSLPTSTSMAERQSPDGAAGGPWREL
jgi:hypothetical protein